MGGSGRVEFYLYPRLSSLFARYSFNYPETLRRLIVIGNNNKLNAVSRSFSANAITRRSKNLTRKAPKMEAKEKEVTGNPPIHTIV